MRRPAIGGTATRLDGCANRRSRKRSGMTVTTRSFPVSAEVLSGVLTDPTTYPKWLVGAKHICDGIYSSRRATAAETVRARRLTSAPNPAAATSEPATITPTAITETAGSARTSS